MQLIVSTNEYHELPADVALFLWEVSRGIERPFVPN